MGLLQVKNILRRNPKERLTLKEIWAHPWVSRGHDGPLRVSLPERDAELKASVLKKMASLGIAVDSAAIKSELDAGALSPLTATFQLLLDKAVIDKAAEAKNAAVAAAATRLAELMGSPSRISLSGKKKRSSNPWASPVPRRKKGGIHTFAAMRRPEPVSELQEADPTTTKAARSKSQDLDEVVNDIDSESECDMPPARFFSLDSAPVGQFRPRVDPRKRSFSVCETLAEIPNFGEKVAPAQADVAEPDVLKAKAPREARLATDAETGSTGASMSNTGASAATTTPPVSVNTPTATATVNATAVTPISAFKRVGSSGSITTPASARTRTPGKPLNGFFMSTNIDTGKRECTPLRRRHNSTNGSQSATRAPRSTPRSQSIGLVARGKLGKRNVASRISSRSALLAIKNNNLKETKLGSALSNKGVPQLNVQGSDSDEHINKLASDGSESVLVPTPVRPEPQLAGYRICQTEPRKRHLQSAFAGAAMTFSPISGNDDGGLKVPRVLEFGMRTKSYGAVSPSTARDKVRRPSNTILMPFESTLSVFFYMW